MSAKNVAVEGESGSAITSYLLDNPRMIGVLFTLMLLVSQAGAVAGQGAAVSGP